MGKVIKKQKKYARHLIYTFLPINLVSSLTDTASLKSP